MSDNNFMRFKKGLVISPIDSGPDAQAANPSDNIEGSIWVYQNRIRSYLNSAIREVVTLDQTQTLTNKTIGDTNTINAQDDAFTIDDAADATLQIDFNAAGTTGTKTTITSSQTANRVITTPDATDTLVGKATTDTLTNKTIGDNNTINAQDDAFTIDDAADATLQIDFDAAGTTSTKTTITSSQTANRVVTLPDATDTLVGKATTDTLTNKTLTSPNVNEAVALTATSTDLNQLSGVTIGGTTAGDLVTLDDTQTLTNKTLQDATLSGTTTIVNSTNLNVSDKNITVNDGGNDASSEGAGLTVERTGTDGSIVYEDALVSKFKIGPVGSEVEVATVSATQTLTNKTIDADSNTITNIENADIKAAAAIDATKLADGSVSNTELQYINSLTSNAQTQLGTKTDTGTANEITLTGTTIGLADNPTIPGTDAMVVTKGTTAQRTSTTAGAFRYNSDTAEFEGYTTAWGAIGGSGGGGGLDVFDTEDFENSTFTVNVSGNNAAFLGGGTLDGAMSLNTTTELSGTQSLRYTGSTASSNDYFEIKTIDLDLKQREQDIKVRLVADMSGFANDATFVCYDKTNSAEISSSLDVLTASADRAFYEFSFYVPSTCAQISFGVHMPTVVNTETIDIDDVEWSTNPFINSDIIKTGNYRAHTHAGYGSTNTMIPYWSTIVEDDSVEFGTVANGSTDGWSFTASKKVTVTGGVNFTHVGAGNVFGWSLNSNQLTTSILSITAAHRVMLDSTDAGGGIDSCPVGIVMEPGEVLRLHTSAQTIDTAARHNLTLTFEAVSEHVITPVKDPGNVFSALIANTGTVSITSESLPFLDSVSRSVAGKGAVVFTSGFFTEVPSITGIVIEDANFSRILTIDNLTTSGFDWGITADTGTFIDHPFSFTVQRQGNDTKDATFLAAVPVQKVVYIKDVQSSGTNGGTFTAGAWQTRTLNTIEGDSELVSLSTNQFTLGAGKYIVEAFAPAYATSNHKAKLRNITDSTDDVLGGNMQTDVSSLVMNHSVVKGSITISAAKTFEIQHYAGVTKATNGFGVSFSGPGVNEVYAIVKITKLI